MNYRMKIQYDGTRYKGEWMSELKIRSRFEGKRGERL